jgi:two-component SAPR family response regulator
MVLLPCVLIVTIAGILYRRLKLKQAESRNLILAARKSNQERTDKPNSIYLFGEFTVRDRNNRDITYMFSAKLRQMLFLVLQYSAEGGITSQRLSNLLWPDRPEHKVKNSRGVTINHLRKVFGELDGIEFAYDKGFFKIVLKPECYCDFTRYIRIIATNQIEENRDELIGILTRGKFLKSSDQAAFDSFKEEMEQKLEPVLLMETEKNFTAEAYRTTIELTDILFNIDPLNDEALAYQIKALQKLKMSDEARIRYQAFITEYKKTMGNDYPHSYKNLV